MAFVCGWILCTVFSVLIVQAQLLTAPEELEVKPEGDWNESNVWKMNISWKNGVSNGITQDKLTYDVRIFYTEQMKLVHSETIELNTNQMGHYKWTWTSPLPLQCTSHSVQLRYRDHDQTSAWTPLKTLPGKDIPDIKNMNVYPINHIVPVGEGIRFCCILEPEHDGQFSSSNFIIRISNRTYVTNPIRHSLPSSGHGFDITCKNEGSTYFTGYIPDDHNLTCETRDLSSVQCSWIEGQQKDNSEYIGSTKYSINGRECSPQRCVLNQTIDTGVMNWTLTAKNKLGTKIIFDAADPKHRVHLKGPSLFSPILFNARNASLEWKWDGLSNYHSFPMICQVERDGRIINETFKGTGLTSLVLADLKPFTEYKTRVQCGSREHFYKWGDWSNLITFVTKEEIPEAVDVWMHVFGEQTYVVWNSLTAAQSHGTITHYVLFMGNSTDRYKESVTKSLTEFCHKLVAGSAKTHNVISISAANSAGLSHPSSITIPDLFLGGGVNTSRIKGNNGSFDVFWEPSPNSSCGYVLDWYATYKANVCSKMEKKSVLKWRKIASSSSKEKIYSDRVLDTDFKEGVKYTLSVYACSSGAPYLLQRREGYMVELPPSGTVQNLSAKQEGLNIDLSWINVHEEEHRGFIEGYNVYYSYSGGDAQKVVISDPSIQRYKFSLQVETYKFTVKAFTSAGEGPGSTITVSVDPQVDLVIINVFAALAIMIFVFCFITFLTYRNWKRVKTVLWPEVPKPMLSEEFLKKNVYQWQVMDQLLCEESEVLKGKSTDRYPPLIVLELQKEHHEPQALNSPHSKDSPLFEDYQTPNSNPQALPLITIDLSYKELPCPGIPNPTYNLPVVPASDTVLVSGYRPQKQNDRIQHQPTDAQWWTHSPSNMSEMHYIDKLVI
ncbi:hypothetical protein AMELA_G00209640 [Ameiurus melas]|uniref:Fibronectin type-III domain-containing protein n=1 Tax=Ameiurus melas TaxID=219545 RepID=A0A7J6A3X2_AMEME|nr:hypothetical protein AMELA_G00209640 [Ameiurus melas]